MVSMSDIIGGNIRRMREEKGIKKRELARKTGTYPDAIRAWEVGRSCPSAYYLYQLSKVLGCTIDDLFEGMNV